jgi:signal transduction histidine kinase
MNTPADPKNRLASQPPQLADAVQELARIQQRTQEARAELAGLMKQLKAAQTRQGQSQAARLLEANEQLVLATLNAQKAAEASQRALREAVEAAQRDALTDSRLPVWHSPAGDAAPADMHGQASYQPGRASPLVQSVPSSQSLQASPVQRYTALAEQVLYLTDVQEANTELLVAALGARGLAEEAEHARRRQAVFLGILAHEMRNPLAPLRNSAALLSRVPNAGPLLGKVQTIIERQLSTMSRLVEDLMDLARTDAGKLRLEIHPVDVVDLMEHIASAFRPAMASRLQRFDMQLPPDPVVVKGDAVRLTQIFTNLLDNASKYTPENGQIELSMQAEGDWLVITVADNGIGITAETLPDIFEPFVQDAYAAAFEKNGIGIGLAVVRDLVEAHGGQVHAKSDGKMLGSVFTVKLPLGAKEAQTSRPA